MHATAQTRWLKLVVVVLLVAPLLSATSSASEEHNKSTVLVSVRDMAGQPLTARVRVAPLHWAERARLQLWKDVNTIARDGQAEIHLPEGQYRMTVSRGAEWSLAELELKAAAGVTEARSITLEHEVMLPGFRAADLHVHTAHSDDAHAHGGVTGEELVAEGVELAAVTDHNHIGGLGPGFESVAGAEITTWAPEVGHFNAFPLKAMPQWMRTNPRKLFAEIARDPNVFVQINHPRLDDHIAYFTLGGFDGRAFARPDYDLNVDGIEVWNGYDIGRIDQVDALLKEWRGIVARGHRITATGGSDCHGMKGHHPGYPRTYVRADSADKLAPALKNGRAFVTNGPLLMIAVNGHGPGDTVAPTGDVVAVDVAVRSPSWMNVERVELWADNELVWTQGLASIQGQALRFQTRVDLEVHRARTLHAVARGGSGLDRLLGRSGVTPFAFTNAVYLTRAEVAHASR